MTTWTGSGRRPRRCVVVPVALLLWTVTACGVGSGADEPTVLPTTPASSSGTSSQTSPTPTNDDVNVIDWILDLGVGAPPGPASQFFEAYELLRNLECQTALEEANEAEDEDAGALVAAAAAACLAAQSGDEVQWSRAEAARDAGLPTSSCLDIAVAALLQRLLAAHEQHPDRTFDLVAGGAQGEPPCPSISELDPDSGAPLDTVTVRGQNLGLVTSVDVRVGDVVCQMTPVGDDTALTIRMPEPGASESAEVVLVTPPQDWPIASATFTYASSSTSDPPTSDPPTSDPTPTPDSPDELDCS